MASEADRREATIANLVANFEAQATKQYMADLRAGVPQKERAAKLQSAWESAQRRAERRWRNTQRQIPKRVRQEILPADCVYCGDEATSIDHILPVSRGGTRDRDNLAPACWPCNREKLDFTVDEWMKYRAEQGLPWPPMTYAEQVLAVVDRFADQLAELS